MQLCKVAYTAITLLVFTPWSSAAQRNARLPALFEPPVVILDESAGKQVENETKKLGSVNGFQALTLSERLAVSAILADTTTSVPSSFASKAKALWSRVQRFANRPVDAGTIELLLTAVPLVETDRKQLVKSLSEAITKNPLIERDLIQILKGYPGTANVAEYVARTLVMEVQRTGIDATIGPAFELLSSATTSGSQERDRLLTTAELFRYEDGLFVARIATAVAVTNADSTASGASNTENTKAYQRRISDVLVALQDGGALSASVSMRPFRPSASARRGIMFDLSALVASSSASKGRRTLGLNGEIDFYARGKASSDRTATASVVLSMRGGVRHASDGIMLERSDAKGLNFFQLLLEGRSSLIKVPIGVKSTWVNGTFKQYAPTLEFFGLVGM